MTTIATRPISRSHSRVEPQSHAAELTADQISTLHRDFASFAGLAAAIVTSTAVTWDSFAAQIKRLGGGEFEVEVQPMRLLARLFNIGHDKSDGINLASQAATKDDARLLELRQAVKAALGGKGASYQNIADLLEKKLPPQKLVPTHKEPAPTEPAESKSPVPPAPSQSAGSAGRQPSLARQAKLFMQSPIAWNPHDPNAVFMPRGYQIPRLHDLNELIDPAEGSIHANACAFGLLLAQNSMELPLAYTYVCDSVLKKISRVVEPEKMKPLVTKLASKGKPLIDGHSRALMAKIAILTLHNLHQLQAGQPSNPLAMLLSPGAVLERDITMGEVQAGLRQAVYSGLVAIAHDNGPIQEVTVAKREDLLPTALAGALIAIAISSSDKNSVNRAQLGNSQMQLRSLLVLGREALVPDGADSFWKFAHSTAKHHFMALAIHIESLTSSAVEEVKPLTINSGVTRPGELAALAGIGLLR